MLCECVQTADKQLLAFDKCKRAVGRCFGEYGCFCTPQPQNHLIQSQHENKYSLFTLYIVIIVTNHGD